MKLTLARFKRDLHSALKSKGLEAEVVSVKWIGQRSKEQFGTFFRPAGYFRYGHAVVRTKQGRTVIISGTIDTNGGYRFKTLHIMPRSHI